MIVVYAVEASHIAEQAKLVVHENNMDDKITVIHGKVEVSSVIHLCHKFTIVLFLACVEGF